MKKSTHSKIKNTAILFELLTRQVTSDTIKGVDKSPALTVIKSYFKPTTEVAKELVLYNTLINESYKSKQKAATLINTVASLRKKLNTEELKKQKYDLIKEIKKHYDLEAFFSTKLSSYKLYASVYRIFEGTTIHTAKEVVDSKYTIMEHLTRGAKPTKSVENKPLLEFQNQDEEVRLLAYKLMIDKFNTKYAKLSAKQRRILKEYIHNISNTNSLREFLIKESVDVRLELEKVQKTVTDKVVRIKLNEAISLMAKFNKLKNVTDDNVLSIMLYHELLKELKHAAK
jgi:hypothetical protein